jgi:hemolysin activation/secretion protein
VTLPTTGRAETPIHYLVWSIQYAANRPGEFLDFATSIALNFAVRNVGATDAEFDFSRYAAHSNFYYVRASDSMNYRFWRNAELGLRLGFQYTDGPLVNNEQYAIGGVDSVRGYLEAESLDDQAINASLELRAPPITYKYGHITIYSFLDAATGRIVQALPGQAAQTDLASWGVGFRGSPVPGLDTSLDWAHALRAGPQTPRGDQRFQFSVRYGF